MTYIVGVTFPLSPKVYRYKTDIDTLVKNMSIVVENNRGVTIGKVKMVQEISHELFQSSKLPMVLRIANERDIRFQSITKELEQEAREYCIAKVQNRGIPMKIVEVSYMLHHSKIIFYFTADGRVDFRALVKDLAAKFRSRIEMRQIGVRDEAQMLGGIGVCGRQLCCSSFLGDFQPVSLENARQSSLGMANDKLIGVCGRFMCCLRFEPSESLESLEKEVEEVHLKKQPTQKKIPHQKEAQPNTVAPKKEVYQAQKGKQSNKVKKGQQEGRKKQGQIQRNKKRYNHQQQGNEHQNNHHKSRKKRSYKKKQMTESRDE